MGWDNQPLPIDAFGAAACALGDVNADGVQDLVATLTALASDPSIPRDEERAVEQQDDTEVTGEAVYAVSGHDGSTLWSNSADGDNGSAVELVSETGPAFEERQDAMEAGNAEGRSPSVAAVGILFMLGAVARARSRRKQ